MVAASKGFNLEGAERARSTPSVAALSKAALMAATLFGPGIEDHVIGSHVGDVHDAVGAAGLELLGNHGIDGKQNFAGL